MIESIVLLTILVVLFVGGIALPTYLVDKWTDWGRMMQVQFERQIMLDRHRLIVHDLKKLALVLNEAVAIMRKRVELDSS